MDVGGTKMMEGPRQFLPEAPTRSDDGSSPATSDGGRSVAAETTSNSLSYWPPPSSALPLVSSAKDTTDGPQNSAERSFLPDSPKNGNAERNPSSNNFRSDPADNKCGEVSRSFGDGPAAQPPRISHHNLPPIVGITSSHNYRAREVQKQLQPTSVGDGASKPPPEKPGGADGAIEKKSDSPQNDAGKDSVEKKPTLGPEKAKEAPVEPPDESADCEIVEVPIPVSVERPKTVNSDYVFSIPNSMPHPKTVLSPRVPTPFIHVTAPNAASFGEALTLNVNSSNLTAGSLSPSGRTAPSPHFRGSSPALSTKCASPSESPRILPSPHSNLASPSGAHRVPSSTSSSVEGSRMPPSPHLNPPSPSQRLGTLPYVPNLNAPPRNNVNNSSVQNFHPEPSRLRAGHEPMDGERERAFKESLRQNQNSRTGLTHSNVHSANPPQRIHQHSDSQTCRNPFELPVPKPYSHPYHHHQQHHHFSNYPNNRHSTDPLPNHEHYINLQQAAKEHDRTPGSTFYPPGFKSTPQRVTNEKEPERHHNAQYKQIFTSQQPPTSISKAYAMDSSPNVGLLQRTPDGKPLRNEVPQRDFSKQLEMSRSKAYDSTASGNSAWNKPETSEVGNKSAYVNAQNVSKNFNKVNGNDYPGVRMPDSGYLNSTKQGVQPAEGFGARFNLSNGEKQNASFNPVSQPNSISQRFPPVPQSNYDLNRQIYDSMTGRGRSVQPPVSRSLEKPPIPFSTSRDLNLTNQINKNQPFYREPEKGKNYIQTNPTKQNEYPGPPRIPPRPGQDYRADSIGPSVNLMGKVSHEDVHRPPTSTQTAGFHSPVQSNEVRMSQATPMPSHHRALTQAFGMSGGHHASQAQCPTNRSQNQSTLTSKHPQIMIEYESKLAEAKSRTGTASQFPGQNPQSMPTVIANQMKGRTPPAVPTPTRSKRESPLDLSVKTVRQSADSTAKDDSEVYIQSYRNFLQSPNHPPENRYSATQSNSDGRGGPPAIGAPKIDFTPDFSGFHAENQSTLHHKSDSSILPPVESFKKFSARLPAAVISDVKSKTGFMTPKYVSPTAMNAQKPQSSTVDQNSVRYSDHFKLEAQKRPSNEPMRIHPSQPKIPKIDPWKLAFDQQIEQRLNSARMSHQNSQYADRNVNGMDVPKSSAITSQYPTNHQVPRHSGTNFRGPSMYPQPPVQTSATPYNPSYVQQPQCQPATPQTPQEKIQHGKNLGHSPDPEQIIKQISKGVMPDHKLLQDKNVLSILRSSLEEKEAKLMQLREAARKKEKYKEMMTGDMMKKPFQTFEQQTLKSQAHAKQSLPPFGALTLERMCAPPSFPGHRLNLPRAVDAVKIDVEPTQKYFSPTLKKEPEKSGIPSGELSPHDDAQGPPTDLDGLAAFLAARIRTKGELKQVGPSLEPVNHHAKAHPGAAGDVSDRGHPSGHGLHPPNFSSGGSPPKLIRESRLLPPLRRRLFSHTEEETPTTSGGQSTEDRGPLPPRDPNGIRSSSETSVFDFRESDSEGEMPVLERQTLEGMRRDRKTFGSKQNVSSTTMTIDDVIEAEKPDVIAELDKTQPDPFWDTAFDMFVEQLEKRPPKRSVRRKKICSRIPFANSESEDGDRSKDSRNMDKISAETTDDETSKPNVEETVTCEPKQEQEKVVQRVQENPGKLSSSRLKIYRDELLREDKLKEVQEKESDKSFMGTEKVPKDSEEQKVKEELPKKETEGVKKEESCAKPRGKVKVHEKEVLEYDSESEDFRSESESTAEDDDDSLSLSGLESESSESEESQESSNSDFTSDDSENEPVAKKKMRIQTRLQTRSTRQRQVKGTGMRLRSKPVTMANTIPKSTKKRRKKKGKYYAEKKKKPSFGDGSHFRPGWEEEFYKFKQQLRMPEKLISISKPPKRSTASLPDLDPYRNSPSLDSSDVSLKKSDKAPQESDESEAESGKQKTSAENSVPSLLKTRNGKKSQSSSILNLLVDKYGKGHGKKQKDLKAMNERKSPRILPKATNKPELLPTPSLGIGKENVLKDKKRSRDAGKKKMEDTDSYLGYFRKRTVNNFKEAFKQKLGVLPQEFSPVILKSRTRNQTKDLKKKATLLEVFGEERPASAPPLSREDDAPVEKMEKAPTERKRAKMVKKMCGGVVTRGRGKLTRSGRPGLRSTAVLRSNKAVQKSKRHLNSGRKRNMELLRIRAMASKKFSYLVTNSENSNQLPITKKRLKLRSVRRKFRSGFDYIRKKKKMKKDGDSADGSVKKLPTRPTSESVEDIQNEIKNWVMNKGLGETILHRAARLGYTDVAAYCLEKMDCSPSPRDNAGYTPLHEACSRGHLEIAKLLLMYGASVSESAKGGIRPLHEAAENGFTELIRLLLSYGADPLLETYTGHTALSLVSDEEARRLIQHHLADVQGNVAPVWTFQGPSSLFDPPENGYDPLCDPPSPHSVHSDCELEVSEAMLPPVYRLAGDRDSDRRWVMMRDLVSYTKAKSKDVLLKQLGPTSVREMKLQEFYDQAKSCNLLGMGDRPLAKASKVILVPYDDKVRNLLGVEKVVV